MSLAAHVEVAGRGVDVAIAVPAGSALALIGPNGAGKTTVIEAMAGVVTPTGGRASNGETVLFDVSGSVRLPAHRRHVALVSQRDDLFPTMSVLDNVAFGPRSRGAGRSSARETARTWLERVDLGDVAGRRPDALSGGQARRVAIARALATRPGLLLLDEPFAGIDVTSATTIRAMLSTLREGLTTVLATHDALDARVLADQVAVIDHGQVVEHGAVDQVLTRPRTAFAARMGARVLMAGTIRGQELIMRDGTHISVAGHDLEDGTAAAIAPRPGEVTTRATGAWGVDGSRTWLERPVSAIEPLGGLVRLHADALAADVEPELAAVISAGDTVLLGIPRAVPYPLETAPA